MDNQSFITVSGKRFHYIWLRDNCLCSECGHHLASYQKFVDASKNIFSFPKYYDVSESKTLPPKVLATQLTDSELIIDWDEKLPHRSIFPISWLLSYAYDGDFELQPDKKPGIEKLLWDRATVEANNPLEWQDFREVNAQQSNLPGERDAMVSKSIERLLQFGFALLRNMSVEQVNSFLSSIGPLQNTEGGKSTPITANPSRNDLGDTAYALPIHIDQSHRDNPHLILCQYCVEKASKGGETILVDGFRVATDFREQHPEQFQLLVETPIQRQVLAQELKYYFHRTRPIIELDATGEIGGVYFNHFLSCNWQIPFDKMEPYYYAYCNFYRYLKNPVYQHCFTLQPGDCLLIQNFRLLHGRKPYDTTSASRHLELRYIYWDYLLARANFEQFKTLYLSEL